MATNRPCFHCGDRKVTKDYNCHSHCEKYLSWQKKKTEIKRLANADRDFRQYSVERTIKIVEVKRKAKKR